MKRGLIEAQSQSGHFAVRNTEFNKYIYQKSVISRLVVGWQDTYIVVSMGILIHPLQKSERHRRSYVLANTITFQRRIKSHLPFAGIIRSSPYSPRFQDNG